MAVCGWLVQVSGRAGLSGPWFYKPRAARSVAEQYPVFDRPEGLLAYEKGEIAGKRAISETL